jgi:cysteinyl-tRNA synthetase
MRFSLALFLLSQDVVSAFTPFRPSAMTTIELSKSPALAMAADDSYDDWYDDFDPSQFDNNKNDAGPSAGSSGRSSAGSSVRSSSRDSEHDYDRDTSYDQSNVDLDAVNYLISERLMARKTGRFEEADSMRDELMDKHGVLIRDKERVWRSGCSSSGSGRRFSPDQKQNSNRNDRFKQKDFGPNGHDYSMARGAGPINSSLSEEEIHAFLAERLQCKLNRDYSTADAIQAELLAAGVVMLDKKKEWRADGATWDEFSARKYSASQHSTSTEHAAEIQAMVDERAQAKSERLYNKADALRDDLVDTFDVVVDDRLLEWSVGGDFGSVTNNKRDEFMPFSLAPGSPDTDDHDEVQRLIEQRDVARADRDYGMADQIREELKEKNVYIDDRKRQWSVGAFAEERSDSYLRVGGGDLTEGEVEQIVKLLQDRFEHKKNRKFKSADEIRDRLQDKFQIQIDDRSREWHVVTQNYVRAERSFPVDDESTELIQELVDKRAVAKLQKDYETADSIRELLMNTYVVTVDDRTKEWTKLDSGGMPADVNNVDLDIMDEEDGDDAVEETMDMDDKESAEVVSVETEGELEKLTVPALKERLRVASLPVSGKKAELIQRLMTR